MGFLTEFFTAIPDVIQAAWQFGGGIRGAVIAIGSVVLTAAFCFAALKLRDSSGWLSAIFGMMAATVVMFWVYGVLPSAWVYFMDGQQELLAGRVVPEALPLMGNFYNLFRDAVVLGETTIAIVGFGVLMLAVQKRFPRALADGEESRPQSGGYK